MLHGRIGRQQDGMRRHDPSCAEVGMESNKDLR